MKKLLLYTVIVLLILSAALPALAGTCYVKTPNGKTVNMRSPEDNSVLAHIPYGTQLAFDDNLSTEVVAYVTYDGQKGYVRWSYLSNTDPGPYRRHPAPMAKVSTVSRRQALIFSSRTKRERAPAPAIRKSGSMTRWMS